MKKLNITFAIVLALTSCIAFADNETILVSDIDDTIKVSHVLDKDSAVSNAFRTKNSFMGMSDVYKALENEKQADAFVYLSNASKYIMKKSHRKFLRRNKFPEGTLMLVNGIRPRNHKLDSLRNIIKNKKPKSLILIGDNGEKDILIYDQIRKEHPETRMITFIHVVYSKIGFHNNVGRPLAEGQIGFATSLDLAVHLKDKHLLSETAYNNLMVSIIPAALKESNYVSKGRSMMFPAWFDCRDFYTITIPVLSSESSDLISSFEKKLNERCDVEPYRN